MQLPSAEETASLHVAAYGYTIAECTLCRVGDPLYLMPSDGGFILWHEESPGGEKSSGFYSDHDH